MREQSARKLSLAVGIALLAVLIPALAYAHVERASYWPNPAADTSVSPPTGGKVPAARSLLTALKKSPPGRTRVVCQGTVPSTKKVRKAKRKLRAARRADASASKIRRLKRKLRKAKRSYARKVRANTSIKALRRSIKKARAEGYTIRPTDRRSLSRKQARRLLKFNARLLKRCKFNEIQPAVDAAKNNDRVVVMPGVYSEPTARKQRTNDPKCNDFEILNDEGDFEALSYRYQLECPNDQNLIAIMGRAAGKGKDPQPPHWDRHGIPNLGPCIRCNVQLEGSGVGPDDVVVDAGRVASGNGAPIGAVKDVGIRADRADGFVLRNLTARHAREHAIYVLESEGVRLERFKVFFSGEYGLLTFVADHHLIQDCEAVGAGDAGLYPGSSAETGQETIEPKQRHSTELRRCDMHHNALGYSGTAANAVWIHHNNIYDNATGLVTDVITASGHPGFPQDSDLIEHNRFYSNNFNVYSEKSDVEPTLPLPVGTGLWILGGNNNRVRRNHIWDNWRRGAMLLTVPDVFVCGDNPLAHGNQQKGCDSGDVSTSYDNRFYENVMGRTPTGRRDPNGVDFWWDQFANQNFHEPPTTTGNCWYDNTGSDGTKASLTSLPSGPLLPSNCDASLGTGGAGQELEVIRCFAYYDDEVPDLGPCDWFTGELKEPQ